jgi:ADP-ribose pyrophosphatase
MGWTILEVMPTVRQGSGGTNEGAMQPKILKELFRGNDWTVTLEEGKLPNGAVSRTEIAATWNTSYVIGVNEKKEVLILREYRVFSGMFVWKLPTGKIRKGEVPEDVARRELREETGFDAKSIRLLWNGQPTQRQKATDYFFLAEGLTPSPLPPDEDEFMEIHFQPLEQAIDTLLSSPIVHTPSAYALMRLKHENVI